ncbi:hypothetical protein PRIPAC_97366 [Pristionchus pacificus]|uniref:Uncharacterized protein n=1 Tax=Pristionchus pacificus TaxID=54126 RepID=A0A2A6D155_PRIPA|nr:hypothetical protein PRIPAC_97366 [Pristionchus pacificus]|eukprot:PDM84119.1 hypothetical protein PRIPAC_34311 [Pristionchus pacificus]
MVSRFQDFRYERIMNDEEWVVESVDPNAKFEMIPLLVCLLFFLGAGLALRAVFSRQWTIMRRPSTQTMATNTRNGAFPKIPKFSQPLSLLKGWIFWGSFISYCIHYRSLYIGRRPFTTINGHHNQYLFPFHAHVPVFSRFVPT